MSDIFSPISIRLKVVLAFALVLLCTIGLGVFALQRLDGVNLAAAEIRDNSLPSTRILGDLAYHTMRFRQLEVSRVAAPDAAAKAEEAAKMRQVGEQAAKSIRDFEPLVGRDEERHWRTRSSSFGRLIWPSTTGS